MKLPPLFLTTALLAPAAILIGLAAPVAFGATTVLGLSSIALADYGAPKMTYHAHARAKSVETLPFAA